MNATNKQKGLIYALGTKCGIYEKGNKRDGLHDFVYQLTMKLSIAELTVGDAERVINHLQQNLKAINNDNLLAINTAVAITEPQIKKVFGLALDNSPNRATIRQRIGGVY